MQRFKFFLVAALTVLSFSVFAQDKKALQKDTVKVWGNCEMCQSVIVKAAKAAGASSAKWNTETKIIAVSYNPAKASLEKIEKAVAEAGYDTEHQQGSDAAYKSLPECCQYDRKKQ